MNKKIKQIIRNFKYDFEFLGIINSPFKFPKIMFYFGDIKVGTPYFLPRKWVKLTREEAINEAKNIKSGTFTNYTFDELVDYFSKHSKPVRKNFGFNWCTLGWKTKWDEYRYEYPAILSFVAFNKQAVICIKGIDGKYDLSYWEAWLYYKYRTKGTKVERLKETIKNYSCTWSHTEGDKMIYENHYPLILRKKYLKHLINIKDYDKSKSF